MGDHPAEWQRLSCAAPELFQDLRESEGGEVHVRFRIGTGGFVVDVPAASLTLQGRLRVAPSRDRFTVAVPGWGPDDFAWFSRRKGRGRPDYWQGAIEYRPQGCPALVLYVTAPLDGLEISVRSPAK
jgi:hypothetical protein